jgi:hypothetical protein
MKNFRRWGHNILNFCVFEVHLGLRGLMKNITLGKDPRDFVIVYDQRAPDLLGLHLPNDFVN